MLLIRIPDLVVVNSKILSLFLLAIPLLYNTKKDLHFDMNSLEEGVIQSKPIYGRIGPQGSPNSRWKHPLLGGVSIIQKLHKYFYGVTVAP